MIARQTSFDEVARQSSDGQVIGVDLATLVQRLLLFDTVVVKSRRLAEIPEFIRAFGKTGFLNLVNSGVLRISYEITQIIGDPVHGGVREQPLSHFTFGRIDFHNREDDLKSLLRPLQGIPGLKDRERDALEETIIKGLVRPSPDYGTQLLTQFECDLRNNTPALVAAIKNQLKIQLGTEGPFNASVEEKAERIFFVRNDFPTAFGISDQKAHEILSRSIFAVAHLNQRLADMAAYSAVSGFAESEASLLFGKFAGIFAPLNPRPLEEEFKRVIRIADLPNVLPSNKIDVQALLKARDSIECREFRSWLSNLGPLSGLEITEMVSGVRNKAASVIQSGPAKFVRYMAATAIGLIPGYGQIAGVAVGGADSFLVDRMLKESNVYAFLTRTYPSLFDATY